MLADEGRDNNFVALDKILFQAIGNTMILCL